MFGFKMWTLNDKRGKGERSVVLEPDLLCIYYYKSLFPFSEDLNPIAIWFMCLYKSVQNMLPTLIL